MVPAYTDLKLHDISATGDPKTDLLLANEGVYFPQIREKNKNNVRVPLEF
jgi:hypothetical protein